MESAEIVWENFPTDRLFTGQRLDDTGLYFYNARYYDAVIGRFISPDSIISDPANPQSFNRYSYVLNNPLKYVDPSGHRWVSDGDDYVDLKDKQEIMGEILARDANPEQLLLMQMYGILNDEPASLKQTLNTESDSQMIYAYAAGIATIGGYNPAVLFLIGFAVIGYEVWYLANNSDVDSGSYNANGPDFGDPNNLPKPESPDILKSSYLDKQGIDAHQLKRDWLGKNADITKWNIYRDKTNGSIWLGQQSEGNWDWQWVCRSIDELIQGLY